MKKILITGVAGMIGSHLLDALLELKKYQIIGIDDFSFGKKENIEHNINNSHFDFHSISVMDFKALKALAKDIDIIIHLAAVKKIGESDSSIETLLINTRGTEYVFEVAKLLDAKVIFASTSDVYGMSPDLPLQENGDLLLGPSLIKRWSYAVSKLYCEQLAYAYYKDYQVPTVILRYFGGFSPRSSFSWSGGHIPIFINSILKDQEVVVHGDGSQTRSMAFVTDLIDGTILAMENKEAIGEIINIGNTEEMSVIDTAHLIHKIADTGNQLKLKFVPFEDVFGEYKDIMRRIPDLTKAKTLLGFQPKVSTEKAIRMTIDEVKQNPE